MINLENRTCPSYWMTRKACIHFLNIRRCTNNTPKHICWRYMFILKDAWFK